MKHFYLTLIFLACGFCATAQNYLFEKDQNGFHIAGQVGFPSGSTIIGVLPGYTWDGRLSLGLGGGIEKIKESSVKSYSVKPYANYLIIKQKEGGAPLSVGLGAAYQTNWFDDNDVRYSHYDDVKMTTFSYDLSLYRRIYMQNNASLIPGGFVGYVQSKTKYEQRSNTYKDDRVVGGIQLTLLLKQFHITPAVLFAKEANMFSLSLGFIFPESK